MYLVSVCLSFRLNGKNFYLSSFILVLTLQKVNKLRFFLWVLKLHKVNIQIGIIWEVWLLSYLFFKRWACLMWFSCNFFHNLSIKRTWRDSFTDKSEKFTGMENFTISKIIFSPLPPKLQIKLTNNWTNRFFTEGGIFTYFLASESYFPFKLVLVVIPKYGKRNSLKIIYNCVEKRGRMI